MTGVQAQGGSALGGVIPFRQNKLTEILFGNAILRGGRGDMRAVMIVNLSFTTSFEENVGVLRYASLAHEIEALPASELGASMSRSTSGTSIRVEECTPSLPPKYFLPRVFSSVVCAVVLTDVSGLE